jgi:hypothetical protein
MPDFFLQQVLQHADNHMKKQTEFLRELLQKGLGQLIAFYASTVPRDNTALSLKRPRFDSEV